MVMSETQSISEKGREMAAKAGEAWEKGKESVKEAAHKTDEAVRSHPYESMGIAFGMGVLIGVLIGRR